MIVPPDMFVLGACVGAILAAFGAYRVGYHLGHQAGFKEGVHRGRRFAELKTRERSSHNGYSRN